MDITQVKDSSFLFLGNTVIKLSNFAKQILFAFFLGISAQIDLYLMALILPTIIQGMIGGGAGEIIVTKLKVENENNFIELYIGSLFILLLVIIGVYLVTLKYWVSFFELSPLKLSLFSSLSIIFILNLIPSFFSSILQPLLYYKGHYRFYVYRTIISEVIAIAFIILTAESLGIYSFAIALTMSFIIQALLYVYKTGLEFTAIFISERWVNNFKNLQLALKQTFLLGIQTLIYHLATFWERSLSIKFLAPSYLSGYNYSKSLSEMPRAIFLSSILTTTYIEQTKRIKNSEIELFSYSRKMSSFLLKLSAIAQILLLLFSPVILILIYKRGQFDTAAVGSTLIIFQLLAIGFVPGLLFHFFSRSMYILGKYKALLYTVIAKTALQILILILFIDSMANILPIALIISNYFVTVLLSIIIYRHASAIINLKEFYLTLHVTIIISIAIVYIYSLFVEIILGLSTLMLIFYYTIPLLIFMIILYTYVRKNEILIQLFKRFFKK